MKQKVLFLNVSTTKVRIQPPPTLVGNIFAYFFLLCGPEGFTSPHPLPLSGSTTKTNVACVLPFKQEDFLEKIRDSDKKF